MLVFVGVPAFSQTPLETRIMQIMSASVIDPDRTGVAAASADQGMTLASINGDTPFNPASCAKIVTSAAALAFLGPDYRFETTFYTDRTGRGYGPIENLYVSGNGDPSLVNEELWQIAEALVNHGIKSISGDIVIDDSFFDGPWYPRKDGDDERAYTATTSAVALNFNSVKIIIEPGERSGEKAVVTADPPTSYIRIVNNVVTGRKFRATITSGPSSEQVETFIVSGTIPLRAEPKSFYRNIRDPARYAGSVLKDFLAQRGVVINGAVRKGPVPSGSRGIVRWQSKPLREIVRDMNKFSNNFIAEQLIKHLGSVKKGTPGTTAKGVEVLDDYLSSLGVERGTYTLENGSGLSAVSRISARQLLKVLLAVYGNPRIRMDFIDSLSVLGVDGTMHRWRSSPNLRGTLRAKTGSLDNVITLAGYVPMSNGRTGTFVILANGFKRGKHSAHDAELMIASAIAEAQ